MAIVWEEEGIKKVVLRPRDVQKILGISKHTVYELFRRADFPAKRLGSRWFVSLKAFERWLETRDEEVLS